MKNLYLLIAYTLNKNMGAANRKDRAQYTGYKHDLGYKLGGKWRLRGYEPAGCAALDDCNADFMFLKYNLRNDRQEFLTFDTFLWLRAPDSEECGYLSKKAEKAGQVFFTDHEFFRPNAEMVFYAGEGTRFELSQSRPNTLKIAKNETTACHEV